MAGPENRPYGAQMVDDEIKTGSKADMAPCETPAAAGGPQAESDAEFEKPVRAPAAGDQAVDVDALIVNLDGYEGPLDILLEMARSQKVDIRKISLVALVEQYLTFIEAARQKNLELAADYLVMASWLAFLKTKLLIPAVETDADEPTADEMAARLAFQLQRLEAMRKATENLFALPQMGQDMFARGMPEGVRVVRTPLWQADLFDLLKAYAVQRVANVERNYVPEKPRVFSLEEARQRIGRILGMIPEWSELAGLVPYQEIDAPRASALSGAFHAALELAKDGRIDLRQVQPFAPIFVRKRADDDRGAGRNGGGPGGAGAGGDAFVDDNVRPLSGPGSRGRRAPADSLDEPRDDAIEDSGEDHNAITAIDMTTADHPGTDDLIQNERIAQS
ncbi:MAG: ScpA family protein [Pseudomonadota bacterium]